MSKSAIEEFFTSGEGYAWWEELQGTSMDSTGPNRRGERAELRRCRTPSDVFLCPAFHRLRWAKLNASIPLGDARLAFVAGILSHVDSEPPKSMSPGTAMAQHAKNSDRALVSGLRFRRLLQAEEDDDRYNLMLRVVRLLDRRMSIGPLATSLAYWNDRARRDWATDYYTHALSET